MASSLRIDRRVNIAWCMLTHRKGRLAVSMAAIGFAVVIMFMQLGFFNGFNDSQARLATRFDGDLVVMDARRAHFNRFTQMRRTHLGQVAAVPGVAVAVAIQNGTVNLKNPDTGQYRRTYALAWQPGTRPFLFPGLDEEALQRLGTVLFDRKARAIYGQLRPGMLIEIDGQSHVLGGFFDFGPNFSNDGSVVMSEASWARLVGPRPMVDWILVRVAEGAAVEAVRAGLREALPPGLIVMTPEEMRVREIDYTTRKAPVGVVFGVGLVVGFIIGTIICYQILFNEINDHLPQFATLKAMGFTGGYLRRVVLTEAALLGVAGFLPGLAGGYALYHVMERMTGIVMFQTPARAAFVFVLTVGMCVLAGLIAVKRVLQADPAEVF